jgi:hypothetical protein
MTKTKSRRSHPGQGTGRHMDHIRRRGLPRPAAELGGDAGAAGAHRSLKACRDLGAHGRPDGNDLRLSCMRPSAQLPRHHADEVADMVDLSNFRTCSLAVLNISGFKPQEAHRGKRWRRLGRHLRTLIDAFGWTWEYIDEEMTIPRLDAITKQVGDACRRCRCPSPPLPHRLGMVRRSSKKPDPRLKTTCKTGRHARRRRASRGETGMADDVSVKFGADIADLKGKVDEVLGMFGKISERFMAKSRRSSAGASRSRSSSTRPTSSTPRR